jgi:hypothetical protein
MTRQLERSDIWDIIFKDKTWPNKFRVLLVGADLPFIKKTDKPLYEDLVIGLVVIWPAGREPYTDVEPKSLPRDRTERRHFFESHPEVYKKYLADIADIRKKHLESLLSALGCEEGSYNETNHEVKFRGFNLQIGGAIHRLDFDGVERLLFRNEDRTFILYYNGGGPSPVYVTDVLVRESDDIIVLTLIDKISNQRIMFSELL